MAESIKFSLFQAICFVITGLFLGYVVGLRENAAAIKKLIKENRAAVLQESKEAEREMNDRLLNGGERFVGIGISYRENCSKNYPFWGLLVEGVYSGTPAAKAEMRSGDIIFKVNGSFAIGSSILTDRIVLNQPLNIEIKRGGRILKVQVTPVKLQKTIVVLQPRDESYICSDCYTQDK